MPGTVHRPLELADPMMTWTEFARRVGRHPATVAREVGRHGGRYRYRAAVADARAVRSRRRRRPGRLVVDPVLRERVTDELRAGFSPAGIAARLRNDGGGALILVTSRFGRATTYGLVSIHPRTATRSHVRTIVWMLPRRGLVRAFDAVDVRVRAAFIRAFIQPDIVAGEGIQYDPRRTIGADALVKRYLEWLASRRATDLSRP